MDSFDTNEFERTLKEHADRFVLMPSERVWKSIYNDIHPGSRWPSLAIGIVMFIGLFWIGNSHQSSDPVSGQTVPPANYQKEKLINEHKQPSDVSNAIANKTIAVRNDAANADIESTVLNEQNKTEKVGNKTTSENSNRLSTLQLASPLALVFPVISKNDRIYHYPVHFTNEPQSKIYSGHDYTRESAYQPNRKILLGDSRLNSELGKNMVASSQLNSGNPYSQNQLNYRKKEKIRKAAWTIFVNPEIANVHFEGSNLNNPAPGVIANPNIPYSVNKNGRMGFQSGADVSYKLTRTLSFTSGVHLNYGGYYLQAKMIHPTLATVTMQNRDGELFTKNYVTYLRNEPEEGNMRLNNYSLQFGIPAGLELTVLDGGNVKVIISSAVEPFVVLSSKAYLLTADGNSFIQDPDLMRRINLNGNFGSSISFNSNKINWKIGPTFRYQILSTYSNVYNAKEHLYNYGIHIGLSKKD